MAGVFSTKTFTNVTDELGLALDWLKSVGISPSPTRLGAYQRAMAQLIRSYEANDEKILTERFDDFSNVLFEVHELIEIHKALGGRFDEEIASHLRAYSSGPLVQIEEDSNNSSNRPRNIGFELALMGTLARASLPIDFSIPTDVATRFRHRSIMFECKRPQSPEAVGRLVKNAQDQLVRKYNSTNRRTHKGVIALDITKIANPKLIIPDGQVTDDVERILSLQLNQFAAEHMAVWTRIRSSRTIGILLRLRQLLVARHDSSHRLVYSQLYMLLNTPAAGAVDISLAEAMGGEILRGMNNAV